jgi:uncharacterized protein (TIGR03083 family)
MASPLPTADYLAALQRDAGGLLAAARDAGPVAPVECCPEWDVADLVWHIGEIHHFWATVVKDRLQDPAAYVQPERPADTDPEAGDGLFAFATSARDLLLDTLSTTAPDTPVWTWSTQHDAAWVLRRMTHETAVHRGDAERAAGREPDVDAALASDGLDEFLHFFLADVVDGAPPLDGTVHLHCTDVDGEWLVAIDDGGAYVVTREHAKGSAAIRGPAGILLDVLWRRRPLDVVEVIGDRAVADRLVARTNLE